MADSAKNARAEVAAWVAPVLVCAVFLLAAGRLVHLIDTYAVNVLFWDQWDLMEPLMEEAPAWTLFRHQHGPHRQGVAFPLTAAVAWSSGWNTRAEAFFVGALVVLAAAGALALSRRLFGPLDVGDAAIPLLVLTPAQYGLFIHTPNASHGAAPLLLLVLYCLALTLRSDRARTALVVVLNFLLLHTGFGLFAGAITPLWFALEARARWRDRGAALPLAGLVASVASGAVFLSGYVFEPALPGFAFRLDQVPAYPRYVALMLANVAGVKGTGPLVALFGFALLFAALWVLAGHARALAAGKLQSAHAVIAVLIVFGLLFCAATAAGRISLGPSSAQSTRYVPLVVPIFLGMLLHLHGLGAGPTARTLRVVAVLALVAATFPMRASEADFMRRLHDRKTRWAATYVETQSIEAARHDARLRIYPGPAEKTRLQEKLDFLEQRRLNLFRDR